MERFRPAIFYIVFFLFILAYSTLVNGYDYDLWARLIAGMAFVQTGQVIKQDFLSYTPTHTWFDHEWGSGVIFYLTQHFFSTAGLLLLQAILVFSVFFFIIKIINLRGLKTTSAYNLLFFYLAFHSLTANFNEPIRCQMFSFLLFTVFLYILELARKGHNRPLVLLPLIMLFWNNIHGGCISGIGLIVLYIVGEFLNRAPVKKYILILIPTTLVLLINPWGLSYMSFLLRATTMERPEIVEWWGIFSPFHLYKHVPFKIYMFLLLFVETIVAASSIDKKTFSVKNIDKTKVLVLAATLYLAIEHMKMVPFFVITSACFIYDDLYTLLNQLQNRIGNALRVTPTLTKHLKRLKDFTVYSIAISFVLINLKADSFGPLVRAEKYPLREIEFLKTNNIKGNLLVNFGIGSYASYKLYPNNLIYMDGRYEEVYYDDLIPLMRDFALAKPNWDDLIKKYPPDVIIFEKFYPIFLHLQNQKDWTLIYQGSGFGVFVRTKDVKKSYKLPPENIDYYKQTAFDTNINFKNRLNRAY